MATLMIRKWDWGKVDVTVERYGASHTHKNVTQSSMTRLERLAEGQKREYTRKYDHATTTIKCR
jgi:hypothetical protein